MKVKGKVIKGQGFASIAFDLPTANLELVEDYDLVPGSYASYAMVGSKRFQALAYIGPIGTDRFEVHLFDFSADLYDQMLEVELLENLSSPVPFESEEQMKAKVWADVKLAKAYFSTVV